jgi:hypothetical protein
MSARRGDPAARAKAVSLALALSIAFAVTFLTPIVARATSASVARGLDYIHACQRSDGGFAEKGKASSSDAITAWAVVAIAAADEDPRTWLVNGHSPVDYLAADSSAWTSTTDYARTVLAAVSAHRDPRSFGGVDLVARILADVHDRGTDGEQIGSYVNSHVWGMLALESAGRDVSGAETKWLLHQQNADGGWGWAPGVGSDTNDTAAAVEALVGAGQASSSSAVSRALSFLRSRQRSDGGFVYTTGTAGDADSTAWVVQAIDALHKSPATWVSGNHSPLDCLHSLQGADGAVRYTDAVNANPLLVTVQTLPALAEQSFPVARQAFGSSSPFRPNVEPKWPVRGGNVSWPAHSALTFVVDDGSGVGVDAASITLTVDGVRRGAMLSAQVASARLASLQPGRHVAVVRVTDRAGNQSIDRTWDFTVKSESQHAETQTSQTGSQTASASTATAGDVALVASSASAAVPTNDANTATSRAQAAGNQEARARARKPDALGTLSLAVAAASLACAFGLAGWRFLKNR